MRNWLQLLVGGAILTSVTLPSLAGMAFISVDENRGGFIDATPGGFTPMIGQLIPDPTGGVPGLALVYTLPFAGTAGDLIITEPSSQIVSDVVRFDGAGHLIFYSDNTETGGEGDLADIAGLPSQYLPATLAFEEQGSDVNGWGVSYHPTLATLPGYTNQYGAPGVTYNIISEYGVPEPASLALLAGGGLGLLLRRRRA